jgi:NADPH-dependent 2,4-dienoyl-CoA reductase/sulfur reductase-like enzyme/nitrite reductase/ring-hydroxylating ferredoxin subunit
MAGHDSELKGPDFEKGMNMTNLPDGGMVQGHAFGEAILVARRGDEVFAIGASCTHYGAPLKNGLLVGDTVRCPWHHACFSLRTGEALAAPALSDTSCWKVERRNDAFYISGKLEGQKKRAPLVSPESIVIIGTGAAGAAASEMLRREGYTGPVTMLGADEALPYDRPNLSKDYLAGSAPEEWIPLRSAEFYRDQNIETIIGVAATEIDTQARKVVLSNGRAMNYGALLLATGAAPNRLPIPGSDLPHVFYLRTLQDSRNIIEGTKSAKRAVIVGASFIGLEVAASLRNRNIAVDMVAKETAPLERVFGSALGNVIREAHEQHGVKFHLGHTLRAVTSQQVELDDGTLLDAELVVVGIGVKPNTALAEAAGISTDRGVLVDEFLETSVPGVFAAGDIARWPYPYSGQRIRVEHWVVAQRQGQTAARNILGRRERFNAVPFFWSNHYDLRVRYVGHSSEGDQVTVSGDLKARNGTVTFRSGSKITAIATVGRDRENLEAETMIENTLHERG